MSAFKHRVALLPSDRQVAVALGYDAASGRPPKLLAKGWDEVAENIVRAARENNIPIRRDADLSATLAHLALGEEIPEELYKAVAEILAFIYRMNQRV